jgi:hypothetical protein
MMVGYGIGVKDLMVVVIQSVRIVRRNLNNASN